MRQPPKAKPRASEEVERVMRVFDMLEEEVVRRTEPDATVSVLWRPYILAIAERIAARTED